MLRPLLAIEGTPERPLSSTEYDSLLSSLQDDSKKSLTPNTTAERFDLSFYKNTHLIQLRSPEWTPDGARICFLVHDDKHIFLNGTSPPIYFVNNESDIILTETTALDYLAFFCFFVRGENGPFLIIDRLDNSFLPDIEEKHVLDNLFRPPRLWGQAEDGAWRASALVYYSENVFFSDFIIRPDGMIDMIEDEPISKDLGKEIQAPLRLSLSEKMH